MTDKSIYKIFNKMNKRDIYLLSNDNNIYKNIAKKYLELNGGGEKDENTLSFDVKVNTIKNGEDVNIEDINLEHDDIYEWYQDRTFFEIDDEEYDVLHDMYGLKLTNLRIKHLHDNVYNFIAVLNKPLENSGISPEDMNNEIETIKDLIADPDEDGNYLINDEVLVRGKLV